MAALVLVALTGQDAGRSAPLEGDFDVGSDPAAGFALEDQAAAGRHARFTVEGGKVRVRDLGSPDGTYLNDVRIEKSTSVGPGDRVRMGLTVLEVLTGEQAAAYHDHPSIPGGQAPGGGKPQPMAGLSVARSLRQAETPAHFVPDEVVEQGSTANRYGPLAAWTDSRIKHQTHAAAIGLLAVSALAVLIFLID